MVRSSKEYGNLPAQEQEFSAYFVSLPPLLGGLGGSPVAPGGRLGSPREREHRASVQSQWQCTVGNRDPFPLQPSGPWLSSHLLPGLIHLFHSCVPWSRFSLYHALFRWSHWVKERDRNGERKLQTQPPIQLYSQFPCCFPHVPRWCVCTSGISSKTGQRKHHFPSEYHSEQNTHLLFKTL